ncbi:DUF1549 domain-containing protein [Prosthecobacter sp.]|uniref:DUF1549 domain-containing protein n=1 Tax=Prosthecobacter sp. TaxID=1965333 RepID=UPI001D258A81|nr:DUF1549 domain-containing protein [Prosthecobacter sp.]MCB1277886.1 DUF1549 domain-containing protein [Prosthecobacter sp.]
MKNPFLFPVIALSLLSYPAFAASKSDTAAAAKEIDSILAKDWAANKLKGNPATDDNTFVRRIYLDVIGRIPTTRETEEFLASKDADKRAKLIDKLLASEAYVQHFFNYWADVLRLTTNGNQTGAITGAAYANFVKESLRENKPYDQFVRDMVAAQGKAWDNGAIGYYMRDRGMPLDNMANTVRVFLGTRIECAQCHNHPFDKWSQMQFYQMAAFTYGVQTQDYYGDTMDGVRDLLKEKEDAARAAIKEPQRPQRVRPDRKMTKEQIAELEKDYTRQMKEYEQKMVVVNKQRNEAREKLRKEQRSYQEAMTDVRNTMRYTSVSNRDRQPTLPHDYQYSDAKPKSSVAPVAMMGHACEALPGETQLQAYARWMTSPQNPRFTTVIANRLWKRVFGLALIEPLDELMDTSTPMLPEMEKQIEKLVVDLKYDMKAVLRVLYNTKTYQAQVTRQEHAPGEVYHFTGPLLRRMSAEQMWDSFVTLINPSPDMINQANRDAMEQRILQAKKIADSIDALSAEEALAGLKKAAEVYGRNRARTDEQQKLYSEARTAYKEAADEADAMPDGPAKQAALAKASALEQKYKDIRNEVNRIQGEGRRVTYAEVIGAGQKKLYEKVTGKPFQTVALNTKGSPVGADDAPVMSSGGDMMMMTSSGKAEKVVIPGYDRRELTKEERQAISDKIRAALKEEADFFGIPEKEQRSYISARENINRRYVRAAEEQSPAPRGHYLREFGQSDRETIENANNDASVPQALAMMNGSLLPDILSKYSQLMLTVNKAQYPDDKVEAAYMTVLSRKPSTAEKQVWLKAQDEGLNSMEDLVFALLNTQQFIFIQ